MASLFLCAIVAVVSAALAAAQAAGSGVIVDAARGHVITNHHVIRNAEQVVVTLKDRRNSYPLNMSISGLQRMLLDRNLRDALSCVLGYTLGTDGATEPDLKDGDVVEVIQKDIGVLRNPVRRARA